MLTGVVQNFVAYIGFLYVRFFQNLNMRQIIQSGFHFGGQGSLHEDLRSDAPNHKWVIVW